MFRGYFCSENSENVYFRTTVEDLPREKSIFYFVFLVCARDHAVITAETTFFANILPQQQVLQISLGENRESLPTFLFVQLRLDKSYWNNVGKLEIVF